MSKKQATTKKAKDQPALTREETGELEMIFDRLAVQAPGGESFEGYLKSLCNSLSARPILAAALIDRLSRNPSPTGFRTFQALEGILGASPYRKSAKQAAYRFSQKGFTAAGEKSSPEKVVLIRDEHRNAVAHLFHVKGAMWIVSALVPEASTGSYALVTAFLEDDFPTFNVRVVESATRKLYKEYLQMLSSHALRRGADVPLRHAAGLFFEMLDFWTGKGSYAHLERGRDIFARYHEPGARPYVYDLMAGIEHPEQFFDEVEIQRLLEDMDLSWLKFGKEELAPWHEKLKELDNPLLVVPREILAERSLQLIRNAGDNLCAGTKRRLFRRFFEEQAMLFKLTDVEDKARWAWIIACDLAGESPAGKNPVVSRLIMDWMNFYWHEDFREAGETVERERRTESGIILP
ncbi:MAG: hypothetical protein M0Z81_10935 [Deltaproteobacteria bacterium]|jgi:hypothetical protein|nr:hypothetical protein [Deltaproteobacteria bacterium]